MHTNDVIPTANIYPTWLPAFDAALRAGDRMNSSIPVTLQAGLPLPNSEIVQLIKDVRRGGSNAPAAREAINKHNIRLVWSIAQRMVSPLHFLFDDCLAEGLKGLNTANDKFDLKRGTYFSTYATYWIRHDISRFIENHRSPIRVPVHTQKLKRRCDRAEADFMAEHGRRPTDRELSRAARMTLKELARVRRIPTTIEVDGLPDPDHIFRQDPQAVAEPMLSPNRELIRAVLSECLSPREVEIICLRYGLVDGESRSFSAIGGVCGVTRQRIGQIEQEARLKLIVDPRLRRLFEGLEE